MSDARTLAVYATSADEYATVFESGAPDKSLLAFLEMVPKGGAILDLGCGTGGSTAHMVDRGYDVTGLDASPEMLAHARARTKARFIEGTFDTLTAKAEYDGIWANFSLLHAKRDDLPRHLHAIRRALKPGGAFHIGMKTGTGHARDKIDRFYTYVSQDELTGLLTEAGLDVVDIQPGRGKGLAGTEEPWIIMRARAV